MSPKKQVPDLEKKPNWHATAKYCNGHETAIMSGVAGGPFSHLFYLYDEDAPIPSHPDGAKSYSAKEIQKMFASGELSLIKGTIPQ
jgi:hypothetical protein